ncbi:MAG: phage terminase large subunit [Rikenellaceae bacterium]|nr:phage terminase large subunit [Rikenellaceae bacterium]
MTPVNKKAGTDPAAGAPPFSLFADKVLPVFHNTPFHETYYGLLERFAERKIRRLIISIPPQHGKSLGASVLLPAYILGLRPDTKITIASYNASLASRFNRRAQRVMDSEGYKACFPATAIRALSSRSDSVRTASHVEVSGRSGELMSVGREGSLTGNDVDVFILDDLYKDAMEANSPVVRDNCWEWYTSVVRTRLHNDSSELLVFTRWHEEDLIGILLKKEKHVILEEPSQLDGIDPSTWLVLNLEAIKEGPPTGIDPRMEGEALWPARHSRELLESKRALDPLRFACMYQGRPSVNEGLLYGDNFRVYARLPAAVHKRGNYTDTADLGDDYLCSVCYAVGEDGSVYVTDVVYSRERMEVTERQVAEMLCRNDTRAATFESNNGGRGFARAVGRLAPLARIGWFHQSGNKEARILSNSATVLRKIVMPSGWATRWPELYDHLVTYRRLYRANRWHDAADVLTGIVETEVLASSPKRIRHVKYASGF